MSHLRIVANQVLLWASILATILFVVIISSLAKRYDKSPWLWGLVGAVAFIVLDPVLSLVVVSLFTRTVGDSDASRTVAALIAKALAFWLLYLHHRFKITAGAKARHAERSDA